jgi:hypothetical protein
MKSLFSSKKKNVPASTSTDKVPPEVAEPTMINLPPKLPTPTVSGSPVIPIENEDSEIQTKRVLSSRILNPLKYETDLRPVQSAGKNRTKISGKELEEGGDNTQEASEQEYNFVEELSDQMRPSINDKKFADAVIRCGAQLQEKFYVHRFILSGRSAYFERIFSLTANKTPLHKDRKAKYCFDRPDIDPKIFQKVLEYCYTGVVKLKLDNVLEILALAEEFGIRSLKLLCQRYLTHNIDTGNACMLLEMSVKFNATELTEYVLGFIEKRENVKEVLKSDSCAKLLKDTLIRIISRDTLQLETSEEDHVFNAVVKWEGKDRDEVFNHVRFPLMSSSQLSDIVEPTKMVNQELLFEAYRYHLVPQQSNQTIARFRNRGAKAN